MLTLADRTACTQAVLLLYISDHTWYLTALGCDLITGQIASDLQFQRCARRFLNVSCVMSRGLKEPKGELGRSDRCSWSFAEIRKIRPRGRR